MKNTKDLITNIVAIISVIGGATGAYLQSSAGSDINWTQLGGAVLLGIVSWLTGKSSTGAPKAL